MSNQPVARSILLTPGPLNTSRSVKEAMLRDWGSREPDFIRLTANIRAQLEKLVGGQETHTAVLLQGSGTFAIEAMIGTLVGRTDKLLVLINGAYGKRILKIAEILGRRVTSLASPEERPIDPLELDQALSADPEISHVALIYCETTSGVRNPLDQVAAIVRRHGRRLLVDAMSAFGALPLNVGDHRFDAVAASANKCLQGVPGVSFVIIEKRLLEASKGISPSLSLDLYEQWKGFEENGQWRFTPPTHVLAALAEALDEHAREGGVKMRGLRYQRNCTKLIKGMREMGFETLLRDEDQAQTIATFLIPENPRFIFETFYRELYKQGFIIYPGKLTTTKTFRIGCIGDLGENDMHNALAAIKHVLLDMQVIP